MSIRLSQIAKLIKAELIGPDIVITGISAIKDSKSGDITWAENKKNFILADKSNASAVIVSEEVSSMGSSKALLRVSNPKFAFAKVLEIFASSVSLEGIHPNVIIGKDVALGKEIAIGPNVVISDNVKTGSFSKIFSGVYIGKNVTLGDNCLIYPNVSILDKVIIGNNVIIHSGCVIGSDGFGFIKEGSRNIKVPQIGTVVIEDSVEIGANVCIDRGTVGSTRIGRGTKIDNLVHVAHNVEIGEDCIIVALTGIAGSSSLGNRVTLAAQVGVAQHIAIGEDSIILGRSGVTKSIPPGSMVSGFPAKIHRETLKMEASMNKLPNILNAISKLEKKIKYLEERLIKK